MKSQKRLLRFAPISIVVLAMAAAILCCSSRLAYAQTVDTAAHIEQYRPQLSYTQNEHWNNDPNGLLYVPNSSGEGGTYHLY